MAPAKAAAPDVVETAVTAFDRRLRRTARTGLALDGADEECLAAGEPDPNSKPRCDSAIALRVDDMPRFRWSVSRQRRAFAWVQLLAVLLLGVLSDR